MEDGAGRLSLSAILNSPSSLPHHSDPALQWGKKSPCPLRSPCEKLTLISKLYLGMLSRGEGGSATAPVSPVPKCNLGTRVLVISRFRSFDHCLKLVRDPRSLAATLAALPSMSRIPSAPFGFRASIFEFPAVAYRRL